MGNPSPSSGPAAANSRTLAALAGLPAQEMLVSDMLSCARQSVGSADYFQAPLGFFHPGRDFPGVHPLADDPLCLQVARQGEGRCRCDLLPPRAAATAAMFRHREAWARHADAVVAGWLMRGLPILWSDGPPPGTQSRDNFRWSDSDQRFISAEIAELLSVGVLLPCPSGERPFCISPVFAISNSNKMRLVVDLSETVNPWVRAPHFQLQQARGVADISTQGDWATSWDLKSGYHQWPMAPEFWTFLGIFFEGRHYVFTCLPFGLACAPYLFFKALRPLGVALRSLGLRVQIYLDDFLLVASSQQECLEQRDIAWKMLHQWGCLRSPDKGFPTPTQILIWLGIGVNFLRGEFFVPEVKLHKVLQQATSTLANARRGQKIRLGVLASFAGFVISLATAFPPARLMTRETYSVLRSGYAWSNQAKFRRVLRKRVLLPAEAIEELNWFLSYLRQNSSAPMWPPSRIRILGTDASDAGWGCWLDPQLRDILDESFKSTGVLPFSAAWTSGDASMPIHWRELRAIQLALLHFQGAVAGHAVRVYCDNSAAVFSVNHGGSRIDPAMRVLARQIWEWCVLQQVLLLAVHVKGRSFDMGLADNLSRNIRDRSDWKLNPTLFAMLEQRWGPHSVDRFASRVNAQLPGFNSLNYEREALATDAFSQDWHGSNNYANPPFNQIARVLRHVLQQRANTTLVVPEWKTQMWWSMLLKLARDSLQLPRLRDTFLPGPSENRFGVGLPPWNVWAFRFEF